ncbi:hypothetical protein [Tenacibaculum ovolyticum]|uniref:hypothetical protein n=1 Tax=Tenacibaculum ovolyticum TaxID=104270 RepID=UPI001F2CA200|nr:hypothetical protein [Tenacibaculum ovolyticum]
MKKIFLLCAIIIITSCSQIQSIENAKNVTQYTKKLESSSINEIKKTIERDTILLNSLLHFASSEITQEPLFSSQINNPINKSVSKFKLQNYSKQEVEKNFTNYCNELYYRNFSYSEYYETFLIESNYKQGNNKKEDSILKKIKNNLSITKKRYFFDGKNIKKENIKLKRIDSIAVLIELKAPIKTNSIILSKNTNNKYNVKIDQINKNSTTIIIPTKHYNNFAEIQGFNSLGKRINKEHHSVFPILTVHNKLKNHLNKLKQNYKEILKEVSLQKIKASIKLITKEQFESVNQVLVLKNHIQNFKKKKNKTTTIFDIIKGYENLFSSNNQLLKVVFPNKIERFELFFNTEYRNTTTTKTIKYKTTDYFDIDNPYILYYKTENDITKTGIVNKKGEVIVDEVIVNNKSYLTQKGNKYFLKKTYKAPKKDTLLWLDTKNRKLIPLNNFNDYHTNIKTNYDVFVKIINDNKLYGIIKNQKEIIFPFDYTEFYNYKNFFAVKTKKNDFELYDINFEKIIFQEKIINIKSLDEYLPEGIEPDRFIIENSNHNIALMNEKMALISSFKWADLFEIHGYPNYYIATIYNDSKDDFFDVIIDKNAKTIIPIQFSSIYPNNKHDRNISYKLNKNSEKKQISFKNFLKKFKR